MAQAAPPHAPTGTRVTVCCGAVLYAGARVGARCWIGAHTVIGSRTQRCAPLPEVMLALPPSARTRSRMPIKPVPSSPFLRLGARPTPSSSTSRRSSPSIAVSATRT